MLQTDILIKWWTNRVVEQQGQMSEPESNLQKETGHTETDAPKIQIPLKKSNIQPVHLVIERYFRQ